MDTLEFKELTFLCDIYNKSEFNASYRSRAVNFLNQNPPSSLPHIYDLALARGVAWNITEYDYESGTYNNDLTDEEYRKLYDKTYLFLGSLEITSQAN